MELPIENIKLKELIQKHCFGSENAFAKEIGINTASINRLFRIDKRSGKIPSVLKSPALLKAIESKFPQASLEWFSNVINASKTISEATVVDFTQMTVMFVPLVSKFAYAGFLDNFGDDEYIEELPTIPFANDVQNKADYLCFEVKGDSMDNGDHDAILEGDILLCRNVNQDYWKSKLHINKWDFVVVHKERGVLIKRINSHNTETNKLILHSLNDYYEDIEVHLKDVHAIFNVVDLRRKRNRR